MNYLTTHQVLFLHARLIDELGGCHGVLDVALLEAAVCRPRAPAEGQDLCPDLFSKAAALMRALLLDPPFPDGSEMTAIASAALFLLQNHRQLVATNHHLQRFTQRVARQEIGLEEIATWFRTNSKPLG